MRLGATVAFTSVDIPGFIASRYRPTIIEAGDQAATLVMDTAKAIVPVDTGRLRDTIDWQRMEDALLISWIIAPHTEYANRIEFGFVGVDSLGRHYNQAAHSYIRAAWDENEAQVLHIFGEELAA